MIKTVIRDGEGSKRAAGVTVDHALKVTSIPSQLSSLTSGELAALTSRKQLRTFFTSGGSNDLNVDGSSTAVDFTVEAETTKAKWITGVRLLFNDTNLEIDTLDFRRFGSATAVSTPLANGVKFFVEQGGVTTEFFSSPITTIGQFLDYADEWSNLVNSVSAQVDFLSFDFMFDTPVVLTPGSNDILTIRVQDDLTDINLFQAVARGYQEGV